VAETRIPFGLHVESKRYVDVREVSSGMKCGCVCPGCALPLIARHCMVGRVDHFAHNTRGQEKKVLEECTFSYWVSLAAMARQIFAEAQTIDLALPEYSYPPRTPWNRHADDYYLCSKAQTITLQDIAVGKMMFEETFDVIGISKDVPVCIKFIHPEKTGIPDLSAWDYKRNRAVVFLIDISSVVDNFQNSEVPLKEVLANFLSNDIESKMWVYHPRMAHHLEVIRRKKETDIVGRSIEMVRTPRPVSVPTSHSLKKTKVAQSQPYRNTKGQYLFYCRRCDHQVLLNATQCFCDRCSGVMYRIHEYQANLKSI
jgi:hypothetical protein